MAVSSSPARPTTAPHADDETAGSIALSMQNLVNIFGEQQASAQEVNSVEIALEKIEDDLKYLEKNVSNIPTLTNAEVAVLTGAVSLAALSPGIFSLKVAEVIIPSMGALTAGIGFAAEYVGRVATADGKAVAAACLQCAAEAEAELAAAERVKAAIPLCVGVSATASAFALLLPELLGSVTASWGVVAVTEVLLIPPFVSILAAAIAALASAETLSLSEKAINVGARRFANSAVVGRRWLSSTELMSKQSKATTDKWLNFAKNVLPAPLAATICPGPLAYKAIIAAALGAAQAAYSLAEAEFQIARAVDSVAYVTRCAAVADGYANQASRAGSILPFTSALAAFCAASAALIVELNPLAAAAFPALGSLFAAAASVSKARCEVDSDAATIAANQIARNRKIGDSTVPVKPIRAVLSLIWVLVKSFMRRVPTINSFWRGLRSRSTNVMGSAGRKARGIPATA